MATTIRTAGASKKKQKKAGVLVDALTGWTPVRSQTSSVTTAWGVQWDEDAIARDLLQNFYDANRDDVDAVKIKAKGQRIEVTAPTTFELERLFYLGSEKDKRENIGQYGEGFKAAALCLVRDHKIEPIVISGARAVRIRASAEAVSGTSLVPLVYDLFECEKAHAGTTLILEGCSVRLSRAITRGLTHFWHPRNPLVGRLLWTSHDGQAQLYQAAKGAKEGVIFYRRLLRGAIPSIPVVLVVDREYAPIEKRTKQDRDRLAFGGELVDKAYKAFTTKVPQWDHEPAKHILQACGEDVWRSGHSLLAALADRAAELPDGAAEELFDDPTQWFATMDRVILMHGNIDKTARIREIEGEWRSEGRKPLPSYFSRFGIRNALEELMERDAAHARNARRKPSRAEDEAIEVLRSTTKDLAPEILALFDKKQTDYFVLNGGDERVESAGEKEQLLGAYRRSERRWDLREVWLAESLFVGEFAEALATFLHEHAHILGYDGSRAFTDELTKLLATILRITGDPTTRRVLDDHRKAWDQARRQVLRERKAAKKAPSGETVERKLQTMSERELRELLGRVPAAVLRPILADAGRDEDEDY